MTIPACPDGVVEVPWPSGVAARARARLAAAPRLLVVDEGAAPPTDCDLDEDWTSASAPPADVAVRRASLAARPDRPGRRGLAGLAAVSDDLTDDAALALDVLTTHWPRPA